MRTTVAEKIEKMKANSRIVLGKINHVGGAKNRCKIWLTRIKWQLIPGKLILKLLEWMLNSLREIYQRVSESEIKIRLTIPLCITLRNSYLFSKVNLLLKKEAMLLDFNSRINESVEMAHAQSVDLGFGDLSVLERSAEMPSGISQPMGGADRSGAKSLEKHHLQSMATKSSLGPSRLPAKKTKPEVPLVKPLETFRKDSKVLMRFLISYALKLNLEKHRLSASYIQNLELLDRVFTCINSSGLETKDQIVSTVTETEAQESSLNQTLLGLQTQITALEGRLEEARGEVRDGLKEAMAGQQRKEKEGAERQVRGNNISNNMMLKSQEYSKTNLDIAGIRRFLKDEYLLWQDKEISKHIMKPVHPESVNLINSDSEPFLGFFELLFKNLTAYQELTTASIPKMTAEEEKKDDQMRRTASYYELEKEKDSNDISMVQNDPKTLQSLHQSYRSESKDFAEKEKEAAFSTSRKVKEKIRFPLIKKTSRYQTLPTEENLVDIELDISHQDFKKKGLLDLVRLRAKNKSFFDEDSIEASQKTQKAQKSQRVAVTSRKALTPKMQTQNPRIDSILIDNNIMMARTMTDNSTSVEYGA